MSKIVLNMTTKLNSFVLFFKHFPIWIPRYMVMVSSKYFFSMDFWDTCVFRTRNAQELRRQSLVRVLKAINSNLNSYDLIRIQNDISRGLSTFALTSGHDEEYVLRTSWVYTSFLFFPDEDTRNNFVEKVIEEEVNLCKHYTYMHPLTRMLVSRVIRQNRICITSDFEGDERYIKDILSSHLNYNEDALQVFVSATHLKNKRSGKLFGEISVNGKFVRIHIGDNYRSDVLSAKKNGLLTIHAITPSYFFSKCYQEVVKGVRLLVKLAIPSLKYSKEIDLLRLILRSWRAQVNAKIDPKSDLFFIGSEGAFLSHGFFNDSIPFNSATCVSFGRKVALKATFQSFPIQVMTRLLIENLSSKELDEFFEGDFSANFGKSLILGMTSGLMDFSRVRIDWSQHGLDNLETLLSASSPHLIDVGYKGTFAFCFNLLKGGSEQVMYSQIFLEPAYRSLFQSRWVSSFQYNSDSEIRVPLNTKLIEVVLSLGPRGPIAKGALEENLWETPRSEKISQLDLWRLMKKPSKKLSSILNSIVIVDDIKMIL
jgi:hypothetical protein